MTSTPDTPVEWAFVTVRFLLVLGVLVALAWWAIRRDGPPFVRFGLVVGLSLAAAAVWGAFVAPNAAWRLDDPARFLLELAVFASGALALSVAGRPALAVAFGPLVAVDTAVVGSLGLR